MMMIPLMHEILINTFMNEIVMNALLKKMMIITFLNEMMITLVNMMESPMCIRC